MTITAPGIDQGFGHHEYRITLPVFAAQNQQTDAGRVALTVHNQSARFPERLVERLVVHDDAAPLAIGGAIHETGAPVVRRVRLYRRSDGQFVGETMSNAEGDYRIGNVPADVLHYAVALDDLGNDPNFNALILDQVVGGEVALLPEPFLTALYLPAMPMEWGGDLGYQQWRIVSITVPGAHCEISELRLFSGGVDVTDDATKSCSDTVYSGIFTNLFDGNLNNAATWTEAVIEGAGFYIEFLFPAGVFIDGVKQGAYDNATRYIEGFALQYYDGVGWQTLGTKSGLSYPGNHSLSTLYSFP